MAEGSSAFSRKTNGAKELNLLGSLEETFVHNKYLGKFLYHACFS